MQLQKSTHLCERTSEKSREQQRKDVRRRGIDSESAREESRSKTSCKPAMAHYIVASERGRLPRAARPS
jgi:hypothetical protein